MEFASRSMRTHSCSELFLRAEQCPDLSGGKSLFYRPYIFRAQPFRRKFSSHTSGDPLHRCTWQPHCHERGHANFKVMGTHALAVEAAIATHGDGGGKLVTALETSRMLARMRRKKASLAELHVAESLASPGSHPNRKVAVLLALMQHQPVSMDVLLHYTRPMQTEDIVTAVLEAQRHHTHLQWRAVYVVLRLLDLRPGVEQHLRSAPVVIAMFDLIRGMLSEGIRPRFKSIAAAAYALLGNTDVELTLQQRAAILSSLASLPQRQAPALEDLLAIVQSVTAAASQQLPPQSAPRGATPALPSQANTGSRASSSNGASFTTMPLQQAVSSLCKLLVRQRVLILAAGSLRSAGGRAGRRALGSLREGLRDLAAACAAQLSPLGPEAAAGVARTCGLLGAGVPFSLVQAISAEAAGTPSWSKALGCSTAALHDSPELGKLEQVQGQLYQVLAASGLDTVGTVNSGFMLVDSMLEQLFQQRQQQQWQAEEDGLSSGTVTMLHTLGHAAVAAAGKRVCHMDVVAVTARCLAEAGLMEQPFQTLMKLLDEGGRKLSVRGCCDAAMACDTASTLQAENDTSTSGHGTWRELRADVGEQLSVQAMQQLPLRCLVALTHAALAAGSTGQWSCVQVLASVPQEQLKQQLGSARKLQLLQVAQQMRRAAKGSNMHAPMPDSPSVPAAVASVSWSSATAVITEHAVQCAAEVGHLLAPAQVVQLLQQLAGQPSLMAHYLSDASYSSTDSIGDDDVGGSTGGEDYSAIGSDDTVGTSCFGDEDEDGEAAAGSSLRTALLPRLGVLVTTQMQAYSDEQLVAVCTSLAKLQWRPGLLRDLCVRLLPRLHLLGSQQAVWLLWGLAKLEHKKPAAFAVARACLVRAQKQRQAGKAMTPSQLATLVWACGKLGYREDALLKPVLQLLIRVDIETNALPIRLVSNVVWACARLGYATERLALWAVSQLVDGQALAGASPQAVSNLAWGLWRLGHQPNPDLLAAVTAAATACMADLPPRETTALLSALARWGARPPARLLEQAEAKVAAGAQDGFYRNAFDVHTLAGCVWALVSMGHQPSKETLQAVCQRAEANITAKQRFASRLRQTIVSGGQLSLDLEEDSIFFPAPSPSSQQDVMMGDLLWACFRCGYSPQSLLQAYAGDLQQRLGYFDTGSSSSAEEDEEQPASSRQSGQASTSQPVAARARLASHRRRKPSQHVPDAPGIAAAAMALGLHHWQDPVLAQQIEMEAIQRQSNVRTFTPAQLSRLIHGLALLGHCPCLWFAQGLPRAIRIALPDMDLQQLSRVVSALGSWPTEELMPQAERRHLLHNCLAPALLAQVAASTSAPSSTSLIMFLLVGLASLGLYRQQVVDSCVDWIMQPYSSAQPSSSGSSDASPILGASTPEGTQERAAAIAPAPLTAAAAIHSAPLPTRLSSLGVNDLCNLIWALAKLKYDKLELMQAASAALLQQIQGATLPHQPAGVNGNGGSAAGQARLTPKDVVRFLWGWAKFNRSPGPELMHEVHMHWVAATSGDSAAMDSQQHTDVHRNHSAAAPDLPALSSSSGSSNVGSGVNYQEVTTVLYSLAIIKEHSTPLAQYTAHLLASMLAQEQQQQQHQPGQQLLAASPRLPPAFQQQLQQVAAALLAAQADHQESPLNAALSAEVKALAMEAWKAHVAKKAAKRPNQHLHEVSTAVERLGLVPRLGAVTVDGVACPDVLVGLARSPEARFALELVGRHNTACNSVRLLGDATIKYRLLQARGYVVIPISCQDWDQLGSDSRAVYIQEKLSKRIEAVVAARPSPVAAEAAEGAGPGKPDASQPPAAATSAGVTQAENRQSTRGLNESFMSGELIATRPAPTAVSSSGSRKQQVSRQAVEPVSQPVQDTQPYLQRQEEDREVQQES